MGACLLEQQLKPSHTGLRGQWVRVNMGLPSLACPIQPFLLICPKLEPRPFAWHDGSAHGPSLDSSCPADAVREDLSLALCTVSKCHP